MIRAFFVSERVYARHIYADYPIGEELAIVNLILLVNVKGMREGGKKYESTTHLRYICKVILSKAIIATQWVLRSV